MKYKVQEKDSGKKIKEVLKTSMKCSSRLLRQLKNSEGVFLNGKKSKLHYIVKTGDHILIKFPKEESYFEPENIPLDVVFEDDDILIINKSPGIVVHPTSGHSSGTIANAIMYYMEKTNKQFKIRFVNRLDRDTSGLLIISKNAYCQEHISNQMKLGTTVKKYWAVVDGILENDKGIVNQPIGRVLESIVMRRVIEDGYESITEYEVIERYKNNTLVELKLLTGRTHQIRVHMNFIGHSVTGDTLYGNEYYEEIERQALHSKYLELTHPKTGELLKLEARLPKDIEKLIEKLKV